MGFETMEMWDAMKEAKYRKTQESLRKILKNVQGDMSAAISASLDVVCRAVHAQVGTFWFYDRFGDGFIHPRASFGGSDVSDFRLAPGEGVAGSVIESGKGVIIVDCQKDPRWSGKVDAATGFVTKSMVCVPLQAENDSFGCIQLINREDGDLFDDRDMNFASQLAEEVAKQFVALELLEEAHMGPRVRVLAKALGQGSRGELEGVLWDDDWFRGLSSGEQKRLLGSCGEIWDLLNRPKDQPQKRGFWRR